jgi:DNA-binding transcriptional MerR regulator
MRKFSTKDLAQAVEVSPQLVRNYEAWGIIPSAERSAKGYRLYSEEHLQALQTVRGMVKGYGWQTSAEIMHCYHQGQSDEAFKRINRRHAAIHSEREQIEQMLIGLRAVTEQLEPKAPSSKSEKLTIGQAAKLLGVRVSSLRFWELQGLIQPHRIKQNGYRFYDHEQVRRLKVIAILRNSHYGIEAVRAVLAALSDGDHSLAISKAEERLASLAQAARDCAQATAFFWRYVAQNEALEEENIYKYKMGQT